MKTIKNNTQEYYLDIENKALLYKAGFRFPIIFASLVAKKYAKYHVEKALKIT